MTHKYLAKSPNYPKVQILRAKSWPLFGVTFGLKSVLFNHVSARPWNVVKVSNVCISSKRGLHFLKSVPNAINLLFPGSWVWEKKPSKMVVFWPPVTNPLGVVGPRWRKPFLKQFFSKVTEGVQKGLHFPENCPWAVWLGDTLSTCKFDTSFTFPKKKSFPKIFHISEKFSHLQAPFQTRV